MWPVEVEAARELVRAVPCAEAVRFFKGGGEATAAAARIARRFTGRDVLLNAGYRGWPDTWTAGQDTAVPRAWSGISSDSPRVISRGWSGGSPPIAAVSRPSSPAFPTMARSVGRISAAPASWRTDTARSSCSTRTGCVRNGPYGGRMPVSIDEDEIRPFRIEVAEADLDGVRRRLAATRWPDEPAGAGWERGAPLGHARRLAERWATTYDWRAHEAALNRHPQFTTVIDGQRVHFMHVRSPEPDALPLIVTHGWPGSIAEFRHVIGPLSDPRRHGGEGADAFHLVIPSIPGFGFSGPTAETGWGVPRIARAWDALMARLGYDRYGAQGGDWGSGISRQLGIDVPERVVGVHVNTLRLRREDDPVFSRGGRPQAVEGLSDVERRHLRRRDEFVAEGTGYGMIQSTRPQTLSYALTDSPAGQLAWIAEKFHQWSDPDTRPSDDDVLTNVAIYWHTATAGSSARLYWEAAHAGDEGAPPKLTVPTGVAVFPYDIGPPVRRFAEADSNIVHWTEHDRGGHFAALEAPDLLVADVRAFFRLVRSGAPHRR